MIAFVKTVLGCLVNVVVLGWLAANMPTAAGLMLGVLGLAATIWVASRIYQIQKRDNAEVRKKQEASLAEMVLLILFEITGRPVTPEVETKVKRLAKSIIDQVIRMPTLRGGGTLHDPQVRAGDGPEEK